MHNLEYPVDHTADCRIGSTHKFRLYSAWTYMETSVALRNFEPGRYVNIRVGGKAAINSVCNGFSHAYTYIMLVFSGVMRFST